MARIFCRTQQHYSKLDSILEKDTIIYESDSTRIFVRQVPASEPILIKMLKEPHPSHRQVYHFENEFDTSRKLIDVPSVRKVMRKEKIEGKLALVMEYFPGASLRTHTKKMNWTLDRFLDTAIQSAQALAALHREKILHRDINGNNILYHPQSSEIRIIDLELAQTLDQRPGQIGKREIVRGNMLGQLEGTLAYISPEQTGRVDRAPDFRSDLYSLGITFYEILAGKLPFVFEDELELVHAHLAQKPRPLHLLKRTFGGIERIPQALSELVLRLLAKNPEDRYQSATALASDLLYCQYQLKHLGEIRPFDIDARELSLSSEWFGKKETLDKLEECFKPVLRGGMEATWLFGPRGVGKSKIVDRLGARLSEQGAYYIKGKFQAEKPYSAWIQALKHFVDLLLTEDSHRLEYWKKTMQASLGRDQALLIDQIPDLQLILGDIDEEAPVPVGDTTAREYLSYVFIRFIQCIGTESNPLIIFLDDADRLDTASKELLELLLRDHDNSYLWIVLAADTGTVDLDEVTTHWKSLPPGRHFTIHHLENWSQEELELFLADTLQSEPIRVRGLAKLLYSKTLGNPYYVRRLLESIYNNGLLFYGPESNEEEDLWTLSWQWNEDAVQQLSITDNVLEERILNVKQSPETLKQVLALAASIDVQFSAKVLQDLPYKELSQLSEHLQEAIDLGILIHLQGENYRFVHEGVREAAYEALAVEKRPKLHKRIGDLLYAQIQGIKKGAYDRLAAKEVFEIVGHWNRGDLTRLSQEERKRLAEFNLLAGKRANIASDHHKALEYLQKGMELLAQFGWQNTYRQSLGLYNEAAEAAYLVGDKDLMNRLVDKILHQTVNALDKVKANNIRIQSLVAEQKPLAAADTGLKLLGQLGIPIANNPTQRMILRQREKVIQKLNRKQQQLAALPITEDPTHLAAMQIINSLAPATLAELPWHVPLLIYEQIKLILAQGNSLFASAAWINFGLLEALLFEDASEGFAYAELGIKLLEKFESREHWAADYVSFYGFVWPLRYACSDALPYLKEAYRYGLEAGDFSNAVRAIIRYFHMAFLVGASVKSLEEEIETYYHFINQIQSQRGIQYIMLFHQVLHNLRERSDTPWVLQGDYYNEFEERTRSFSEVSDHCFKLYFYKLMLAYFFEAYEEGVAYTVEAEPLLEPLAGLWEDYHYPLYYCLTLLAVFPDRSAKEKRRIMKRVMYYQARYKDWALVAPDNFLHKYHLIEGERMRVMGQEDKARFHFEKALMLVRDLNELAEESLTWLLLGKFFRIRGQQFLAEIYFQQAVLALQRWDAHAIVEHLYARYPKYLGKQENLADQTRKVTTLTSAGSSTSREGMNGLDMRSITKASQALSGEVVLSNLLEKLLMIVMENAGATRGIFIDCQKEHLKVLAEGSTQEGVKVSENQQIASRKDLPHTMINYALRTKQALVLDDAFKDTTHGKDPYLQDRRPASVLCFPIVHKGKLNFLIYLENALITHAFTAERIEMLDILSSQIAISIENARLYESLDEKVRARTHQLNEKNKMLGQTLDQLKSTQSKLVESEKMASLGLLTAGIAHEINNPINFITGNINPLTRDIQDIKVLLEQIQALEHTSNIREAIAQIKAYREEIDADYVFEEIEMLLAGIRDGALRTKDIVLGLKNFSRLDEDDFKFADLHQGIDSTLTLLNNELKNVVEIHRNYGELPRIECRPGKLNQVFMNLLTNAMQAIKNKHAQSGQVPTGKLGDIFIETQLQGGEVVLSFKDTGTGMSTSVKNRIFEPFFTTKDVGEGTGLGLAIVYGIIEQHKGSIIVESEPGEGANFIITLPINQSTPS